MKYGTGNPPPTGRNHRVSVVGDGFPVPVSCFMLLLRQRYSYFGERIYEIVPSNSYMSLRPFA